MTSALATGRAAFVTLPRMFKKVGRAFGRAVPAVARMADANAKARSRRIAPLLPQPRVYGAAGCAVKRSSRRAASGELDIRGTRLRSRPTPSHRHKNDRKHISDPRCVAAVSRTRYRRLR